MRVRERERGRTQGIVILWTEKRGAKLRDKVGGVLDCIHQFACIKSALHVKALHLDDILGILPTEEEETDQFLIRQLTMNS